MADYTFNPTLIATNGRPDSRRGEILLSAKQTTPYSAATGGLGTTRMYFLGRRVISGVPLLKLSQRDFFVSPTAGPLHSAVFDPIV